MASVSSEKYKSRPSTALRMGNARAYGMYELPVAAVTRYTNSVA